ncbi:MAG: type II toxin-antitoxin system PemK/MazF family toxin [bacterium]|nr:type II toxin-antitoxin system PemK/MazF family toxin [bacterium]
MKKDFDKWNSIKKKLEEVDIKKYIHPREIWWCSLGLNLGAEIDGKNENFERPVIIMKVYNKETMVVLPLTTKQKDDKFHYKIQTEEKTIWAKLTQVRLVSNKRLLRKVDVLNKKSFSSLRQAWLQLL